MSDVKCPYCETEQEICHDDGYGYEQEEAHQQECGECEKNFVYYTSISFYYNAEKADCLNGSDHKFKAMSTYPKEYTKMICVDCEERREPTESEMKLIMERAGG